MVSSGDQKERVVTSIKHYCSTPLYLCCNESYNIDDMPEDTYEENNLLSELKESYEV